MLTAKQVNEVKLLFDTVCLKPGQTAKDCLKTIGFETTDWWIYAMAEKLEAVRLLIAEPDAPEEPLRFTAYPYGDPNEADNAFIQEFLNPLIQRGLRLPKKWQLIKQAQRANVMLSEQRGWSQVQAFQCPDCESCQLEATVVHYECSGCGNLHSWNENESHRCPECNKFAARDGFACDDCDGGPLEEIEAYQCEKCDELFIDEDEVEEHLTSCGE